VSTQANVEGDVIRSSAHLELKPDPLGGRLETTLLSHGMTLTFYTVQKMSHCNFYCQHFQHPTYICLHFTSSVNAAPTKKLARPPMSLLYIVGNLKLGRYGRHQKHKVHILFRVPSVKSFKTTGQF
jgi:hypothetical protein